MVLNKLIHDEKGMVLVIVLMILMATIILSMGAMMIATTNMKISGNYKDSTAAFFAAEAGVERALNELKYDENWSDGFTETTLSNGAKYKVDVTTTSQIFRVAIVSTGWVGRNERIIEIVVDVDSVFRNAINVGGDLTLVGKPRISEEGVRANGHVHLELDSGTPELNIYIPDPSNYSVTGDDSNIHVFEHPPMDLDSVRLSSSDWEALATMAPEAYYYDLDGVFNSKDTDVTLNKFDCDKIPPDDDGKRTLFVDGNVTFTGKLDGTCTVVATGSIKGEGKFVTSGATVSMISMGDVLMNYDTNTQSTMNGLVYSEGNYEMHGKIKFTGVVTAFGDVNVQNPSEFTNNSDSNYWYTYSSAYTVLADPIDVIGWHEKHN